MKTSISATVNGRPVESSVEPRTSLADLLREELRLTATHLGCEQGVCGACTVLIDGQPARSCIALAVAIDGSDIRTLEGFDQDPLMQTIKAAFHDKHGLQCGFCTPGMLISAWDLLRRKTDLTANEIRIAISGNLCRCTGLSGYRSINPVRSGELGRQGRIDAGTGVMKIEKSFELQHPREFVWRRMNDVYFVARCLPGASIVQELGEHRYKGRLSVKVGPMAAAFDGEAAIESKPGEWTASVSGKGADARSSSRATGAMTYRLSEGRAPGATRVDVVSDINLAGPLAQFGKGAVMQEVANRITAEFVRNFESALTVAPDAADAGSQQSSASSQPLDAGNLLWSVLRDRFLSLFRTASGSHGATRS